MREPGDQYLQTVGRALGILNCFYEEPEWSLTELSRRLGFNKTVTFRLVATLAQEGYLEQDPHTKRYRLGPQLLVLGLTAARRSDIRQAARPVLERLADETGESSYLTVVRGRHSVCLDKVNGPQEIQLMMQVGGVYALHKGASNKVLLAYLDPADYERYLRENASRLAEEGVDRKRLEADLEAIRNRGYAYTTGEVTPQAFAVACPVFDGEARLAGAVSVAGPSYRLQKGRLAGLITKAREAAIEVTRRLGGKDLARREGAV